MKKRIYNWSARVWEEYTVSPSAPRRAIKPPRSDEDDAEPSDVRRRVREAIRACGGEATSRQIAEASGLKLTSVDDCLRKETVFASRTVSVGETRRVVQVWRNVRQVLR